MKGPCREGCCCCCMQTWTNCQGHWAPVPAWLCASARPSSPLPPFSSCAWTSSSTATQLSGSFKIPQLWLFLVEFHPTLLCSYLVLQYPYLCFWIWWKSFFVALVSYWKLSRWLVLVYSLWILTFWATSKQANILRIVLEKKVSSIEFRKFWLDNMNMGRFTLSVYVWIKVRLCYFRFSTALNSG